jgi:hypothetical protein
MPSRRSDVSSAGTPSVEFVRGGAVVHSRALVAEALGTAFLLAAVVGSGIMGEQLAGGNVAIALLANTLATGAALVALILTFGPISGAHFNPAVSLADASQGGITWAAAARYVVAQIVGALVGVPTAVSRSGATSTGATLTIGSRRSGSSETRTRHSRTARRLVEFPRINMALTTQALSDKPTAAGRRFPIGAEVVGNGLVHFRVWAPRAKSVEVAFSAGDRSEKLCPEGNGYFSEIIHAHVGDGYRFRLDGSADAYPDPASRFQPCGPHQASEIVDPRAYQWQDDGWRGITLKGQVIYELHTGTFTQEGTWASAQAQLEELARIGITAIELMPVAEFDGQFGWGYDGGDMFAPSHLYGRPDDLRRFVDAAHTSGLGVLLDVVYNHFGPVGNYLGAFSSAHFTDRYANEWGEAITFDGPDSNPVREFFVTNAAYWIQEFHFDGLRLDATQQIFDGSDEHILTAIGRAFERRQDLDAPCSWPKTNLRTSPM